MTDLTLALAGNPNAGKSTLFNALTGLRQHTGNWPGKTVEKKHGTHTFGGHTVQVVDLPGAYSLTAYSPEEQVAREFILADQPDVVVNVLDATNLERNLYLTVQLLEMGVPVVVALNMTDELHRHGAHIDREALARALHGTPVLATTANRGEGVAAVMAHAVQATQLPRAHFRIDYGPDLEADIAAVQAALAAPGQLGPGETARWLALKLLEADPDLTARMHTRPGGAAVVALAAERAAQRQAALGDDFEILAADRRYGFVNGVTRQVLKRPLVNRLTFTEAVDNLVTHRWLGLPIFFAMMYVMFRLVIDVSAPFLDWTDALLNGYLAGWVSAGLLALGAPGWLHSLVVEGALAGVGGVLVFVPGLLILFFFLAVLEDTGYMARAAFVMDKFMRVVGLHGKSFIPMILGFGCAVPAVYATRTLASRRDRVLTALLIPLMSCSARLPVYVVFGMAFFAQNAGTVIWALYALGIAGAMLAGMVFTRTVLKPDTSSAFVLELPPYRIPALKSVLIHMWENTGEFVRKAGTVILGMSLVMWALLNLPLGVENQRDSLYGQASAALAPVFAPLGFGSWQASGALVTGFIAKEVVVSTLSQVYAATAPAAPTSATPVDVGADLWAIITGLGEATQQAGQIALTLIPGVSQPAETAPVDSALTVALARHFDPLSALAFLVFVLLYVPCVSTLGAIKHEFGWRWAVVSAVYQTTLAWVVAALVFQVGRGLGWG